MTPSRVPVGISSYAYRWAVGAGRLDAWQLVERAKGLGLDVLQLLDNVPLDRWPDRDLQALGQAAEGRLTLQVGMSGLDRELLTRYVEVARLCGAGLVRATADGDPQAAGQTLRQVLPALRSSGTTLALENHFDLPSTQLRDLVRRLDDPHVAICLDTLNSIALLEGPAETVAMLAPHAVCLHIKDGAMRRLGTGFQLVGTVLGEGSLDLPALLQTVWAAGRRPPLLVELWQDPAASQEATLAAEEDWVTRSLACARRLVDSCCQADATVV